MKSDLAERLLQSLMDWDVPRFGYEVGRLQMLASLKYDEYGGYTPGVKFAENLARWLVQFDPDERQIAFDFILQRLIFISDIEIAHLIEVAYPDHLEQHLIRRVSLDLEIPPYLIHRIAGDPAFQSLCRRSLFLGLSDGARLDRLRRASRLSHEQFSQDYDIHLEQARRFQVELGKALTTQSLPGDATFRQVFLVDDFSGSGETLLRQDATADGGFKGKLVRFQERLGQLREAQIVSDDVEVLILLYLASEQAVEHVRRLMPPAGLEDWRVLAVQQIGRELRVDSTDANMAELCRKYYDPSTADEHKKDAPIGYSDCALPLVLGHNTPNNSVCLLWMETSPEDALGRVALFPRYERHHKDRP